jgi:hypothetical protein
LKNYNKENATDYTIFEFAAAKAIEEGLITRDAGLSLTNLDSPVTDDQVKTLAAAISG